MRFQGLALGALLIGLSTAATTSAAIELDPDMLSGTVVSLGQAHSRHDSSGQGTAFMAEINHIQVFLNGGVGHKSFDEDTVTNGYIGVGISGLLQLQYGDGSDGPLTRIRTDINISRFMDFFAGRKRNRFNQSFGTRLTFSFAGEEYKDDKRFDNFQAGIGLIF
ncbi:MAG: hypothetical protein K0R03_1228 [Moraxellaceae bacterium]|jgi:hypothetical protein|nr:hypothetical protein [Moraxellaceae bacterium]MDF3030670.1 hypothetical protein [Moraxellaceae bacterium]